METNWNQLIERYLQNELSEEGKTAFEEELATNASLREELELHQLVQAAAKRASQRVMVQQTGKMYFRNLRIKQFTITAVLTIAATVGIVYWVQREQAEANTENKNQAEVSPPKQSLAAEHASTGQPAFSGDKRSLIHSSDSCVETGTDSKSAAGVVSNTNLNVLAGHSGARSYGMVDLHAQNASLKSQADTMSLPKPTTVVLGYADDQQNEESTVIQAKKMPGAPEWIRMYDSVGKFNDLYCGYALVMRDAKFGFIDNKGKLFIPLVYDEIVVTTNLKTSKQKDKRSKKKILYIPKRSGKDVKDCDENYQLKMERF